MSLKSFRILAAGLVLAGLSSIGAQAETRTPYRSLVQKVCSSSPNCSVLFPTIASNRRVELENISCRVVVNNGQLNAITISTTPAPTLYHFPAQAWTRVIGSIEATNFSEPTGLFGSAGQKFKVDVVITQTAANSVINLFCSLYGDLVILP
jgi:hypothetical protein